MMRTLSEKDKQRIEKNKEDPKKAMVIKTINKEGKVVVYPGSIIESWKSQQYQWSFLSLGKVFRNINAYMIKI